MNVHLFGKIDSPSAANYALKKTAKDNKHLFDKRTTNSINDNFYMDDLLDSFENTDLAISTIRNIIKVLSSGGFHLTKFTSNSNDILKSLPKKDISTYISTINLDLCNTPIERALGILWDTQNDLLKVKGVSKNIAITKIDMLSFVSSIFDPLDILTPAIIEPKLITQQLRKEKLDWDDLLPLELTMRWENWLKTISSLQNISIPRWYGFSFAGNRNLQLHVFADASNVAYGAVAYLRYHNENDNVICSFLLAKSRLSPLKENTLSIPRLELQAAVLACRLKETIINELKAEISETFFWSDSKIVLNNLNNNETNFGVYTAHRVNEIRKKAMSIIGIIFQPL